MGREGRKMMRCIKDVQTPGFQLRGQVADFPGPDFVLAWNIDDTKTKPK
jgi:hypothetical protein